MDSDDEDEVTQVLKGYEGLSAEPDFSTPPPETPPPAASKKKPTAASSSPQQPVKVMGQLTRILLQVSANMQRLCMPHEAAAARAPAHVESASQHHACCCSSSQRPMRLCTPSSAPQRTKTSRSFIRICWWAGGSQDGACRKVGLCLWQVRRAWWCWHNYQYLQTMPRFSSYISVGPSVVEAAVTVSLQARLPILDWLSWWLLLCGDSLHS